MKLQNLRGADVKLWLVAVAVCFALAGTAAVQASSQVVAPGFGEACGFQPCSTDADCAGNPPRCALCEGETAPFICGPVAAR
jgi:hypothetical protein